LQKNNPSKNRPFHALFAAAFTLFLVPMPAFTQTQQTLSDIAEDFTDLSDDIGGSAPFVASIGLNWANGYIGHLIDIPPHWGLGLTMGTTTLKMDKLDPVTRRFGYECDDDFMRKQLMPAYVIEARIGGFRTAPFDLGIKWGFLPYLPLFKNDVNYSNHLYGIDFRWELARDWGKFPSLSVGFEVDHISGGLRRKSALIVVDTDNPTMEAIAVSGDGTAGVVWDAWVFNGRFQASKRFWEPSITLYAGIRLGMAITKSGIQFEGSGSDVIVHNGTTAENLDDIGPSKLDDVASYLDSQAEHDMSFTVTNKNITGWISGFSVNFSTYEGIAFNFDNRTCLDISIMVDFVHFEVGAGISYRFQQ
jgi:hypothetical protein